MREEFCASPHTGNAHFQLSVADQIHKNSLMTHSKNQFCIPHTELFYVKASSEQDRSFPPPSHGAVGALRAIGGCRGCADQKGVMLGGSVLTWTLSASQDLAAPHFWELAKRNLLISLGSAVWQFFCCLQQIPPLEVKFT